MDSSRGAEAMQRWIWTSLTAALLAMTGAAGLADENSAPNYEGRLLRRHEELSRSSRAENLRFERAKRRARERIAREETYERLGYSPLRPNVSQSGDPFSAPYYSWGRVSIRRP